MKNQKLTPAALGGKQFTWVMQEPVWQERLVCFVCYSCIVSNSCDYIYIYNYIYIYIYSFLITSTTTMQLLFLVIAECKNLLLIITFKWYLNVVELSQWLSCISKVIQNCQAIAKQHRQRIMHVETHSNDIDDSQLSNTHLQEITHNNALRK